MVTVGEIRKVLAKIDGVTFTDREELESAILPLFGPLQPAMPGKTFRDIVDILLAKGWAVWDNRSGTLLVKFPPEIATPEIATPTPVSSPGQGFNQASRVNRNELTFREIALLVHLHSNDLSRPNLGFESLISKGMVERVNVAEPLTEGEVSGVQQNIVQSKTEAVGAIFNEDFRTAMEILTELHDAQRYISSTDFIYRLTDAGKVFMQDQPDSILDR